MKIYLSAIETVQEHSIAAAQAQVPHVLTSFFYCAWKTKLLNSRRRTAWEVCLRQAKLRLADSGAHTFRTAGWELGGAAAGVLAIDYDEFLDAYVKWTWRMSRAGLIDNWVELDIGLVTGSKWVNDQRRKLVSAGLGHGLIQVWHSDEHDWDYWMWLLREAKQQGRSNYVAIEGHNKSVREEHDYARFLHAAYARGVKVHAFKVTDYRGLQKWPFYSVDSTSWIAPSRYGCRTLRVRSGGVVLSRATGTRNGMRDAWAARIPRTTNLVERLPLLVRSAQEWVRSECELTEMWKRRGIDWDAAIAAPEVTDGSVGNQASV